MIQHRIARRLGVAPCADPHPFLGLEIFIVGEEMLDLLDDDRRQVGRTSDMSS